MLTNLLIRNFALIDELEIQPDAQFNIITGETGAGKSILLGAIGLLLGNRADIKSLFLETEKCIIEGTFTLIDDRMAPLFEQEELDFDKVCIVRREILPTGKSRAFINDTPVTLETLRAIAGQFMDIHSQHDSIQLGSNEYQLSIVDTFAQSEELVSAYQEKYKLYQRLKSAYEKMQAEATANQKEFDYNQYLLTELQNANIKHHEQEELEQELTVLEHAEEVKLKLLSSLQLLEQHPESSIIHSLAEVKNLIQTIAPYSQTYRDYVSRLESCVIELNDIAGDIVDEEEKIELDDARIHAIQERLDLFFRLQQKHGVTSTAALLDIQAILSEKVSKVLNISDNLSAAKERLAIAEQEARSAAEILSEVRSRVLNQIEKQIVHYLHELGMPNAALSFEHQRKELALDGTDTINILFTANKGMRLRQLREVASGGEFSRLMLVIKYILADKRSLPTILFDEIDTGISGEVAIKVGGMMQQMSKSIQVIAISHLHQIAGKGTAHYFVYKDHSSERTISRIKQLNEEERILEIAKMIGGDNPSESALKSAREMLVNN